MFPIFLFSQAVCQSGEKSFLGCIVMQTWMIFIYLFIFYWFTYVEKSSKVMLTEWRNCHKKDQYYKVAPITLSYAVLSGQWCRFVCFFSAERWTFLGVTRWRDCGNIYDYTRLPNSPWLNSCHFSPDIFEAFNWPDAIDYKWRLKSNISPTIRKQVKSAVMHETSVNVKPININR